MEKVDTLHGFEKIKILSVVHRMRILRLLMSEPYTLSQLGTIMGNTPAWVRHHIKILESAGLIEVQEQRITGRVREIYYRAISSAILLQELILPKTTKPIIIFSGSHDTAIEHIATKLSKHVTMQSLPVGSLDGLVNLRQGLCHIAGAHLLDRDGEYNTPFVRHFFPDRAVTMITLAYRTQGLILQQGNPKGIQSISDLARPDVFFLNRNPGSGTRLWFDRELDDLGIPGEVIKGYWKYVMTHNESADAVKNGWADATLGIQAAATERNNHFIPLFEERYDLVIPAGDLTRVTPMLEYLQTATFRKRMSMLTGYSTQHSGEQVAV